MFLGILVCFFLTKNEQGQDEVPADKLTEATPSFSEVGVASSSDSLSLETRSHADSLEFSEAEESGYIDLDFSAASEFGKDGNDEIDDILHLMTLVNLYDSRMRDDLIPTGMNEDFVDALSGGNSERMRFIRRSHPRIDKKGRFLDQWQTPYFFHSVSLRHYSIRSAGPDRIFNTEDDVVRSTED